MYGVLNRIGQGAVNWACPAQTKTMGHPNED